jgi:hypothetical protein
MFSDIPQIKEFYGNIQPYINATYNWGVSCGITLFKYYIDIYTYIQQAYNHLYDEYPYFTLAMDEAAFYKNTMYSWIGNYHVEPNEQGWILTQFLMENNNVINNKCYEYYLNKVSAYLCKEIKHLPNKCIEKATIKYDETVVAMKSIVYGSNKVQEGLLLMRLYNNYICRSAFHDIPLSIDTSLPIEPCSNHFINVEYTHPSLKHTIPIDLTNMYLVNNIVLSPLFLHYVLSLQPMPYIIDDNYVISIMDQEINMFTLTYDKYILFEKDKYYVKEWKTAGKYMGSDGSSNSSSTNSLSDIESDSNNDEIRKPNPHPEYSSDST